MNFIEHLEKYLSKEIINDLIKELEKERTSSLILNTNKISSEDFIKEFPNVQKHPFLKNVFYFDKNIYQFGKSYLFDNGVFYIMDASSMLVSEFLNPNDNDLILDMCAAPGGKSIYLSLKNKNINLISNDISYPRALTLSSNVEKLGLDNITVINYDFLKDSNILNNTFDKIILDAPCSGSAMFRKMDEMKEDWSYEKVLSLSSIQYNLLNRAIDLLKDGGELIYSTCSFSFEENEENILKILKERNDIFLIELPHIDGEYRSKELHDAIHLFPMFYKGEGQFIAKIKKNGILLKNKTKITENKNILNKYKNIISTLNLNFKFYKEIKNHLYASNYDFLNEKIPLIRYGIDVCEIKKDYFIPSFNFAHYLPPYSSISLNENEMKKYIKGESLNKNLNLKDGYYVVSFNNINLGYVKYVKGILKNLYPKGLRH